MIMGIYKPGRPKKYIPSIGKGEKPSRTPGEYRIRDEKGVIVYVGETNNLTRRMQEHIRTGKLKKNQRIGLGYTFEYKEADGRSTSKTRREHEQMKIKQHNPSLNKSKGGEGRIAQKLKKGEGEKRWN